MTSHSSVLMKDLVKISKHRFKILILCTCEIPEFPLTAYKPQKNYDEWKCRQWQI